MNIEHKQAQLQREWQRLHRQLDTTASPCNHTSAISGTLPLLGPQQIFTERETEALTESLSTFCAL